VEKLGIKNLLKNHSSRPNNPDIANAFFRCISLAFKISELFPNYFRIISEITQKQQGGSKSTAQLKSG